MQHHVCLGLAFQLQQLATLAAVQRAQIVQRGKQRVAVVAGTRLFGGLLQQLHALLHVGERTVGTYAGTVQRHDRQFRVTAGAGRGQRFQRVLQPVLHQAHFVAGNGHHAQHVGPFGGLAGKIQRRRHLQPAAHRIGKMPHTELVVRQQGHGLLPLRLMLRQFAQQQGFLGGGYPDLVLAVIAALARTA